MNVFSRRGCLCGVALTRRGICVGPAGFTHQPLLNEMLWVSIGRGVGFCTLNSTVLCEANFVMKALKMFLTCCRKGLLGGSSCLCFQCKLSDTSWPWDLLYCLFGKSLIRVKNWMGLDLQKDNNHLMIFKMKIISLAKACVGWRIYNLQSKLLPAGILRIYELRFLPQNHLKFEWREELNKIGFHMEKNVWGPNIIFTGWGMWLFKRIYQEEVIKMAMLTIW